MLTGKGVKIKIPGPGVIRTGEETITAGFLMLNYPLTNFEIQKYYQYKPKFDGVYLRNELK